MKLLKKIFFKIFVDDLLERVQVVVCRYFRIIFQQE